MQQQMNGTDVETRWADHPDALYDDFDLRPFCALGRIELANALALLAQRARLIEWAYRRSPQVSS